MKNQTYDHVILGTGQATGTLMGRLIPTGDSIAVIEGAKVGGSCVNYGCTPTKALVASAKAIHTARRGLEFGFKAKPVYVDYPRIRERMNEIRNSSSEGLTYWMESTENVDLIRGWGTFNDARTIRVDNREVTGEKIYINVGMRPVSPPIEGLETLPWLDSERLLGLEELPPHLLIIGGGYIGMEYAQIYRRFGSEVTVIQRSDQVMPKEDEDVAKNIQEILEEEGIRILCGSEATRVHAEEGKVQVDIDTGENSQTVSGSHLLIAAGRRPNSDKINPGATGIATDNKGFIEVDDYCRTNVENVYALGDVNGEGAYTHTSVNDAEIVLDHIFGGNRKQSDRISIYGLFIDPPLGRIGMTEKEALAAGKKVLKATKPMSSISRAKEMSETKGFAKLLVDADTDLILGASVLGPGGDEIINMFTAIMYSKIPCHKYRKVVLVHPTVSELMPWILDDLEEVK